jgi:DNA helicase-2/ATP-dependent DNA helicase PcrA
VVQLLTVHGSKGLEWDAVAVVRLVEEEFPARVVDTSGWFGFGVVPFALRGDRDALPRFDWDPAAAMDAAGDDPGKRHKAALDALACGYTKAYPNGGALRRFKDQYRAYQQQEERRLAYVAVTRARSNLLLTGAHWAGQKRPRTPSPYLQDAIELLGLEPVAPVDPDENPYEGPGLTRSWPMDPLGDRRAVVSAAVRAVHDAAAGPLPAATPELERLLAERAERQRGVVAEAPTRVPASRFKDYVTDYRGTLRDLARPMPERPYTQTRIGTLFHAWVEHRSGLVGAASGAESALWELDEDVSESPAVSRADESALLRPIAVEIEIDFVLGGAGGHIVICKLDAVYRREDRGGRIEIVDWKTGKAPRSAEEREERMLQLALYRLAYHRRFGVPLEDIDVALYYVADDLVIRGDRVYSEEELVQRWSAARAAR